MTRAEEVVWLARKLHYIRELPDNRGARVEALQRWSGGAPGQPWCAYLVAFVLDIAFEGKSPLPRTGSCDVLLETATRHGWLVPDPEAGDVFLVLKTPTDAVHTGFVTEVLGDGTVRTLEGNTNDDGSRDGYGVFERVRPLHTLSYIHYPR